MKTDETADVIVIGLGAFGSATAWQLARRGAKVIALDRFAPPHAHGSSHGATRITRLAVGEGEVYVPLVQRSHEIWAELEARSPGRRLYRRTGGLIIGLPGGGGQLHGRPDFVRRTIEAAQRFGIAHEVLDGRAVARRFPQFVVRGDELAYYEPGAGVLDPEACVTAQIEEARRCGASIHFDEAVLSIEGGVVRTARASYAAQHVVVTAGAWIPGLAGEPFASRLKVLRQVMYWFKPTEPSLYAAGNCPVFIWQYGTGEQDDVYGFPAMDESGAVKLGTEQYRDTTDPDGVERTVSARECREMFDGHVAGHLRGVSAECVRAATCLYTVSADSNFVVDTHPRMENVTVVSACSGHGFKHSAGLGEQIALRLLGEPTRADWGAFALKDS